MQGRADSLHSLTTGPAWWIGSQLPGLGAPLRTSRGIATDVDALSHHVVPKLIDAGELLDPASLYRGNGQVDLHRLTAAAPLLRATAQGLAAGLASLQRLPARTWLGSIDSARAQLSADVSTVAKDESIAYTAARIGPAMLGATSEQTYFVAFENEAETRGTGGIPGTFGLLHADNGKLHFDTFEPDSELGVTPVDAELGSQYDTLFAHDRTENLFVNSNLSPNFPDAARIWLAMWQRRTGQTLDGAIAVDPTELSYILRTIGPVATHRMDVTASDVVAVTQHDLYQRFAHDNRRRKQVLVAIARAIGDRLVASESGGRSILTAIGRGVGSRRVMLYSANAGQEQLLEQTGIAGEVPVTTRPYAQVSIVNDGGNKLDYYLGASLTWARTTCGPSRDVTATVELHNGAPTGLPAYVTQRSDRHAYPVSPGDNRLLVSYYATHGATLRSVTVNGSPATAAPGVYLGHPVFTVDLELPRGSTRQIAFHLDEPASTAPVRITPQPLVHPMKISVADMAC